MINANLVVVRPFWTDGLACYKKSYFFFNLSSSLYAKKPKKKPTPHNESTIKKFKMGIFSTIGSNGYTKKYPNTKPQNKNMAPVPLNR
jgi:hypothetical protein